VRSPAFVKGRLRSLVSCLPRLRNRHFLLLDILLLCLTPALALFLRVDGVEAMRPFLSRLAAYTLAALVVRLAIFYPFGLYNRYWRSATVDELIQTILAVLSSTILITLLYFGVRLFGVETFAVPRSLPLLDGLLTLIAVGGTRFSARWAYTTLRERPKADAKRVLIVGAGVMGQVVVKELRANPQLGLRPVAFLDDDHTKQSLHILNLPVLGTRETLAEVVRSHRIAQVVIAMPHAPGKKIREVVSLCEKAGVPAKIVPGMSAILGGRVSVSRLRNVEIEDLLGREPVETDIAAVRRLLRGKRVLITGAGGSIGGELCRQTLQCGPSHLALLGHGENSVFEIQNELLDFQRRTLRSLGDDAKGASLTAISAYIADIRFPKRIHNIIQEFRPDIIFHAAAHKHVPLMELNPAEAITNNVFGTKNLLEAALAADVDHFVMISTDKAVNPTSVMGASKRVAELLVLRAARQSGKPYGVVRFGNVLGSRGSVVPTFKRQIAAGGPVTVSHPDMTRYFMTIPEAVQLVLQASVLGRGGEVFMLDMGEPVKIVDLARDLIELSGLEVGRDIDIVFTGIRPGEKLYEELLISGESYERTAHEKIRIARDASGAVPPILDDVLGAMAKAVANDDRAEIVNGLLTLIPEFQPDEMRRERIGRQDNAAGAPESVEAERDLSSAPAGADRRALS